MIQGLCQKNNEKKMDFFSIKICLLNHRKFVRIQEGRLEMTNETGTLLKRNVFLELGKSYK